VATVTPAGADLYASLGVDSSATGDDIARAFRARAKQLHPDTNDDPAAARQFADLVAAYQVLSNHRSRRAYDETLRERRLAAVAPARRPAPAPTRWTPRRAWTAFVGGILVTLLGAGTAVLTWTLHERDAQRRTEFVGVTAERIGGGDISFTTADGRNVVTREPSQHGEGNDAGPTVKVRYDPNDPAHVVVDASSAGRDITLAIVALKLLAGGPVFAVLGARRLRRYARGRERAPAFTGAR
jgi:curved DNA-binding protein CbpA